MTLDTTPLAAPIDRAELKAFTRRNRTTDTPRAAFFGSLVAIGAAFCFVLCVVVASIAFLLGSLATPSPLDLLAVAMLALVAVGGYAAATRALRAQEEFIYRTAMFARANGLVDEGKELDRDLPGVIFHLGRFRASFPVLRRTGGRFVEFANYRYTTGDNSYDAYRWGYVAIKLDVQLPNIVLDARENNGVLGQSNLPVTIDPDQRLSLEGDFDRHFALYCPAGYERDALYLFTPDIMARFIDNAAQLDVEIVDDWLFLYAKRPLVTTDPETWTWLMTTVDAVTQKLDQWARWRDDKLPATASAEPLPPLVIPPLAVAAGGQRLQRKRQLLKGLLVLFAIMAVFVLEIVFVFSLAR
jgi:hypothetical protein